MSYRPITDVWFLARCKYKTGVKRYGGYPGGFPERARALLGVNINDHVLHVCGGLAKLYPYAGGFGPNDCTLDLDPSTEPDFLMDACGEYPGGWGAILIDPPYSEEDAAKYPPGAAQYPSPNKLLKVALDRVVPGGRVGILHYILPSPPPNTRFVAAAAVMVGFNNRVRIYSVFERTVIT